jgi:hypothetical protein
MSKDAWLLIAAFGLPLFLLFSAFVVGCFEKHPVRQFESALLAQLPPYLLATMRDASSLGFMCIATGVHTKFRDKLVGVLLISPDRLMLAMIGEGAILGMPSKKTLLLSRMKSGQLLLCTDDVGTAELDPGSTRKIVMNARFAQLNDVQRKLIQEAPGVAEPFVPNPGWGELDALFDVRAKRMVQAGRISYADANNSFYRYRPWWAFRVSIIHGIAQSLKPQNLWRHLRPRAG